ncbi:MAG: replication-associated recombination protein A [Chloroflexota bacterium]|nr:replication-associated recombination protein A [Chloroflexota bacterium]
MKRPLRPQASLFGEEASPKPDDSGLGSPLAARLRPADLHDFVGQEHLIGRGRALRLAIERDQLPSMILWGPPGSGKTTLARIVAQRTHSNFVALSAVSSGVAELRQVIDDATRLRRADIRTILFIDEIHRFNKSQQDAVLQAVEEGVVTLIGATTENPSFEVNSALLSRCRVFTLHPLSDEQIDRIVQRGLESLGAAISSEARSFLVQMAHGDARVALTALELAAAVRAGSEIDLPAVEDALQHRALDYDRQGDQHYDVISAFIKSVRGSDPDAAIYWLARMLEAGEDPLFVVRRMVILAAEDVGLADPQALSVAVAAQQAVHFVGMPEGYLPLAECALYLATAPKSNSALTAYRRAAADLAETGSQPVPLHLRNAVTGLMVREGYGRGYMYAHDYNKLTQEAGAELPPAQRLQDYLPQRLTGRRYYEPGSAGFEAKLRAWLHQRREEG